MRQKMLLSKHPLLLYVHFYIQSASEISIHMKTKDVIETWYKDISENKVKQVKNEH